MSSRTLRFMGLGMVAAAGAGFLSLAAMTNPGHARADDIGLVLGGSGTPIPGNLYVESAAGHYLFPTYGTDISFYQGTPTNPFGEGLYTPEGLYPLTGVHTLPLNYPAGTDGFPSESTSVGQGATILTNTIESEIANGNTATVFGYSQSSTISSIVMQQLAADHISSDDVRFLLVGDPSAPDGGLLSRFDGYTDMAGMAHNLQLNLPSLGVAFDGATPSDDYVTSIYSIEYDGFTDFPKYPLNFLADLNAFLGIQTLHGHYLDGGNGTGGLGTGPSLADIANATHLPTSTDVSTEYYMITTLGGTDTVPGAEITPPLVALLPAPLQQLLGPDLTYLINLGYGDGSQGWADGPADVNTPFGLFPDVSMSEVFSNLAAGWQQGLDNYAAYMLDPGAVDPTVADPGAGLDFSALLENLAADPTGFFTDFVNALTTASSALYSTLLPTADIINALVTSMPAYDFALFADNIANGDLLDAIGLPFAADTALFTLAGGFELEVLQSAATDITNAFAGLFS
ncbi:PE-PPE domain-containing protein [Candidatus Mycobacterium wuenschmannii]|uniref:PE-PPE domain-containing protein n=1 Tax=Candidatus Mycobacterium wuenschmannii TaxID=3027808 RepID=A0ABY8VTI3_9MYCO|nr:PE-PPE domain-containing protein [Candidatus Mycobacterium wuenschmannii]WIM86943.1 PE-PPE domain-containing protein [Candidatus Mycobacterium wuenschmannii]